MKKLCSRLIYPLAFGLALSASQGPLMESASSEESLAGKYLREYYSGEGCIEGFNLPRDAKRGNILYMFHGERVGMPEGSNDPKDQFNLNLREEEFGTKDARVCGLKKGPYKTFMSMLDLDSWKLAEYPSCWILTAK